ncbi:MAG: N-ethylammeline chlorohydrolase [Ignavibacteriae bacterium]|nr:MAG: N-ethylammeline chlorohydrolase [Ignavibacteriota bacterium]
MKKIIIPKNIVTVNNKNEILKEHYIEIENGIITEIDNIKKLKLKKTEFEVFKFPNLTMIPGFVQTHVHLCQTLFRGLAEDMELLDWLQKRIFPYENAHTSESLRISTQLGIHELQKSGTTTLLDMGTINYQEVIFDELIQSQMRATAGKCMMDINDLYPDFIESTEDSLTRTSELAREFHDTNNQKIKYGFAPRFVLSCSEELLTTTKEMMQDFAGSIFHTHSSENKNEIEAVKKMYNMENIEYFSSINVLDNHTVLAHGIHVNEKEIGLLKKTDTRISHCPSSNLKLASGIADIPRYLAEGISVSLGADGAPCNNNLSQFREMRLASLIQKPIYGATEMDARTVFRLATIDGAKALHLENNIGSIEIGKKADLVLLNLEKSNLTLTDKNIYSSIIYSASAENVEEVMIDGNWVVQKNNSVFYDEKELYAKGKEELNKLLKRTKIN